MKVIANLGVNVETLTHEFDLEELEITESEWAEMTPKQKKDALQEAVNDLNEQPYWLVENFDNA